VIKILLADDHVLFRKGLKRILEDVSDFKVIAEVSDGDELLEILPKRDFDVLLLDLSMPGLTGADLILRITESMPDLPIIVLTMHKTPQFVKRKLQAGARGYITKDCDPDALVQAIRKVIKGGRYISHIMAEMLAFDAESGGMELPHERLTLRETQVFELLVKGVGVSRIAEILDISDKTVSTHKTRLMRKMKMTSNAQLLAYGIRTGRFL